MSEKQSTQVVKSEILKLKHKQLLSTKTTDCQIDELCIKLVSLKMFFPSCIGQWTYSKSPVLHKNVFFVNTKIASAVPLDNLIPYAGLL